MCCTLAKVEVNTGSQPSMKLTREGKPVQDKDLSVGGGVEQMIQSDCEVQSVNQGDSLCKSERRIIKVIFLLIKPQLSYKS